MAGYSGTPLIQKLGIKEGHRVHVRGGPPDLLPGVALVKQARAPIDVLVAFVTSETDYRAALDTAHRVLRADGGFWVAWPKRSSGVPTDLTEDVIRDIAVAETTLVDNKVCAIDDTWSGLRLVVRKEARAAWTGPSQQRRG
jgi:hypothetical protein